LVTLDLPDDSPVRDLPWIITFGPLTDAEEWEPVVCGPYQQEHAIALAEEVIADEQLMAVVEPMLPLTSPQQMRDEIVAARAAAIDQAQVLAADAAGRDEEAEEAAAYPEDYPQPAPATHAPAEAPDPTAVRAGMARVVAPLTGPVE
jgi:hypothetical protein